ncbi:MAG: hypothetical protein HC902_05215 [Calothrix sp. SM1_5_4]|nr:hypothetical protein [Calothrix sp. SM1_5_4]
MVVSVAGSTELGQVDPIDKIQDCLDELVERSGYCIPHHVDAAYGGYFASLSGVEMAHSLMSQDVKSAIGAIGRAHSVTMDPHKMGYVPYSCGAFWLVTASPIRTGRRKHPT